MDTSQDTAYVDAYLVIDQPWQRFSHWSSALAALDDDRAPTMTGASGYYDPGADQALVAVRYDAARAARGLALVIELALLEEIGVIQPAELTPADRDRFVTDRLSRCTVRVGNRLTASETFAELVRRIRDHRASRPAQVQPPPAQHVMPRPAPRGDTADPVLLVAKGTRDDLSHRAPSAASRPPTRRSTREDVRVARTRSSQNELPHPAPRSTRDEVQLARSPEELPQPAPRSTRDELPSHVRSTRDELPGHLRSTRDELPRTAAHVVPRRRVETAQVSPVEAYRKATTSMLPPVGRASSPSEDQLGGPLPPGTIYARYLRSGRWIPIRIGALSLRGAALLTGALPRIDDHVEVALAFGGHRAIVRGSVGKVSSPREVQVSGTSTFSVNFDLDAGSRNQLTSLLTAARAANVTIKPPPPRTTRRFPIDLPLVLRTTRGVVRGDAFDVSREGLFVKPAHPLTVGSVVGFSSALDLAQPISGRARVVRHLAEVDARACGVASGYGLQVVEMAAPDHEQWARFLARTEQRASRQILVGAAPERLVELQQALASVGYAVCGESDAAALLELSELRPIDAALIDGGWPSPSTSAEWVESMFAARKLPCVAVFGDARRARITIDRLLSVA